MIFDTLFVTFWLPYINTFLLFVDNDYTDDGHDNLESNNESEANVPQTSLNKREKKKRREEKKRQKLFKQQQKQNQNEKFDNSSNTKSDTRNLPKILNNLDIDGESNNDCKTTNPDKIKCTADDGSSDNSETEEAPSQTNVKKLQRKETKKSKVVHTSTTNEGVS